MLSRVRGPVVVLAADTVVYAKGQVLGKPQSVNQSRRMLKLLSGRSHWVITGVVLFDRKSKRSLQWAEKTRVTFVKMTNEDIDDYLASGEPFDKAGSYAVQGKAAKFVKRIEGCFFNVVGLPLARVCEKLKIIAQWHLGETHPSTQSK